MVCFALCCQGIGHSMVADEKDLSIDALTMDCLRLLDHVLPDNEVNRSVPIILI